MLDTPSILILVQEIQYLLWCKSSLCHIWQTVLSELLFTSLECSVWETILRKCFGTDKQPGLEQLAFFSRKYLRSPPSSIQSRFLKKRDTLSPKFLPPKPWPSIKMIADVLQLVRGTPIPWLHYDITSIPGVINLTFLTLIVAWIIWRLWRFTITPLIWRDEVPMLPYLIPLLGHTLSFLRDMQGLFKYGK